MKTKYIVCILLVLFIIGCSDDDDQTNKERLPQTAQAFIESHLLSYQILNIEDVDDKGDEMNEKYIVTFSDDILVSFSSLGFWRRIKSSSELPTLLQEVIPFNGAAEVKNTYPIVTINEINFTLYGCQAVTSIGVPIAFYDISYSNKFGLDLTQEKHLWPGKTEEFFNVYYNDFTIDQPFFFIKDKDAVGSEYRFGTSSGTKVYFDKDGNWYSYERGSDFFTIEMYEALLPQAMRDILEQKYNGSEVNNRIYALLRHDNYYQVSLKQSNNEVIPIMFDTNTNKEAEALDESTLTFLNTYVGKPLENTSFSIQMMRDAGQIVFQIKGGVAGAKVLTMYTDTSRKMLSLNLNGSIIPDEILTYLPAKVKEYAEKNYAGNDIMAVMNGLGNEFYILYKNGARLRFDKDGNVVG